MFAPAIKRGVLAAAGQSRYARMLWPAPPLPCESKDDRGYGSVILRLLSLRPKITYNLLPIIYIIIHLVYT